MENIDIDIDKEVMENIDIDKKILANIDIDKISNRLELAYQTALLLSALCSKLGHQSIFKVVHQNYVNGTYILSIIYSFEVTETFTGGQHCSR